MIAEATPDMERPFQSDHAPLALDLHVVRILDADRNRGESREAGRIVIEARLLEAEPQRIYGFRLRDAYLHVPVSEDLLQAIAARVGRAGVPGRREGGKIWGLVR